MIRSIAFDWGFTVMADIPDWKGPLVEAPHVEAMPGIRAALEALRPHYRLMIATNAVYSNAQQVRAALALVGLDAYFDDIMTTLETGLSKPDPAYFAALLARCGCAPHEAVLVGDTYPTDVAGAKQAGLRAVWYNWRGDPLPPDTRFEPDAVIREHAELPAAIRSLDGLR